MLKSQRSSDRRVVVRNLRYSLENINTHVAKPIVAERAAATVTRLCDMERSSAQIMETRPSCNFVIDVIALLLHILCDVYVT